MKVLYIGDLHTECIHESGAKIEPMPRRTIWAEERPFRRRIYLRRVSLRCMVTVMGDRCAKNGGRLKGMTAEVEKEMASESLAPHRQNDRPDSKPACSQCSSREKLEKAALDVLSTTASIPISKWKSILFGDYEISESQIVSKASFERGAPPPLPHVSHCDRPMILRGQSHRCDPLLSRGPAARFSGADCSLARCSRCDAEHDAFSARSVVVLDEVEKIAKKASADSLR